MSETTGIKDVFSQYFGRFASHRLEENKIYDYAEQRQAAYIEMHDIALEMVNSMTQSGVNETNDEWIIYNAALTLLKSMNNGEMNENISCNDAFDSIALRFQRRLLKTINQRERIQSQRETHDYALSDSLYEDYAHLSQDKWGIPMLDLHEVVSVMSVTSKLSDHSSFRARLKGTIDLVREEKSIEAQQVILGRQIRSFEQWRLQSEYAKMIVNLYEVARQPMKTNMAARKHAI